ncbi:hypothetical protein [Desulforamulus ruminis]|uniref:hypothetical protein n=1 Tax=Desulforamulus ruminis TaxID=1564 RepID=UPI002353F0CB|nr:hypothetical protein [Desulforamulus ruminis]
MHSPATILNLDRLAAKHGQAVIRRLVDEKKIKAGDVDNSVTKALGVLQENGVYACFLYLLAKEKNNGGIVVQEMLNLLENLGYGWGKPVDRKPDTVLAYLTDKVTKQLEPLLLAKETLEKMLTYARYGAKAKE